MAVLQPDLSFCGVPRDADWTPVIPDPMLRVGSALGFSHMQPEHARRTIEMVRPSRADAGRSFVRI
jgi:hypothetical protein